MASIPTSYRWAATVVLIGLPFAACSADDTDIDVPELLPASVHGLGIVDARSGDAASQYIGQLHERDVAPSESHIGFYGEEPLQVVIYVSRFATEDQAAAQLSSMSTSIGSGSSGFGHHTQMEVGGLEVHTVFGHGQVHHFYAQGTDVTWLATPPALAQIALAELLNVSAGDIPEAADLLPSVPSAPDSAPRKHV